MTKTLSSKIVPGGVIRTDTGSHVIASARYQHVTDATHAVITTVEGGVIKVEVIFD